MSLTLTDALFNAARQHVFDVERQVAELRSELVRKDAEIARLSSAVVAAAPTAATASSSSASTPPGTRGVFSNHDLAAFLASPTCHELVRFLEQLSQQQPQPHPTSAAAAPLTPLRVDSLLQRGFQLLETVPLEDVDPQRFGNKAFRKWHALLAEEAANADDDDDGGAAWFTRSFGDPTRIDFGTGHEVAFLMLLMHLFKTTTGAGVDKTTLLAHFQASTLHQYFALVRALRAKYRLEPAGSHGVWSLDDYHFLPFVLGTAQLATSAGGTALSPADYLREALQHCDRSLDSTNYLANALLDVFRSKRAACFAEHSPMLNQLLSSSSGDGGGGLDWKQLHLGLVRMWQGEVLGKFPVAQHFVFGSPALPITWQRQANDNKQQQLPQPPTAAVPGGGDPVGKYFKRSSQSKRPSTVAPPRVLPRSSSAFAQLDDADVVQLGQWRITAKSEPRIGGQPEIDALGFDFPLPEMLFTHNVLDFTLCGGGEEVRLQFDLQHALGGCQQVTNRKLIKVPMAGLWQEKTDADGRPIRTWREDYDWTFTSLDLVKCSSGTGNHELTPTELRIDYDRLKRTDEPIRFFKEVAFFEDDLFDLGLSQFTAKVRVMDSLFFALGRVFVRVDGSFFRVVDCRVYHDVNTKNVVLVERSVREAAVKDVPALQNLTFAQMNDSNYIAALLPLVGEPETWQVLV